MRVLVFILLCSLSVLAKAPPLPSWSAEDKERLRRGEIVVGIGLLTDALQKEDPDKPKVEVIIEAVNAKPDLPGMETLSDEAIISASYLEKYFGERPESSLIDPQQLLSMQERADLGYALEEHEMESDVPIFVYLFDAKQKLPEGYSPRAMFDKVFAEQDTPLVIVYYFMGDPGRSEFLLAGGASDEVPEWQVRELLWNSAHKAREKSDVFDQLSGFVGQLSMRLFWVEEILNELRHSLPAAVKAVDEDPKVDTKFEKVVSQWKGTIEPYVANVLIGVFATLLSVGAFFFVVVLRKYRFPENPSPKRLGGEVGGKCGGVLRYRDTRVPPAMQKKQFEKDFL